MWPLFFFLYVCVCAVYSPPPLFRFEWVTLDCGVRCWTFCFVSFFPCPQSREKHGTHITKKKEKYKEMMTRTAHHTKWQSLYIASIKHRKREREQGRGDVFFSLRDARLFSFFFYYLLLLDRSIEMRQQRGASKLFFLSEETLGHTTPDTSRLPITSHKNVRVQNPSTDNWPFNSNWSEVRILFINFFFLKVF